MKIRSWASSWTMWVLPHFMLSGTLAQPWMHSNLYCPSPRMGFLSRGLSSARRSMGATPVATMPARLPLTKERREGLVGYDIGWFSELEASVSCERFRRLSQGLYTRIGKSVEGEELIESPRTQRPARSTKGWAYVLFLI